MISEFAYEIERKGDKVCIYLDESFLPNIIEYMEKLAKKKKSVNREEMFRRRIVPFMMNQFLHWSVKCKLKVAVKYLKDTKRMKDSRQKKFELGDLQDLFSKEEMNDEFNNQAKIQTQKYWKQFLQSYAEESVLTNSKIKSQESKQQYINYIPNLIQELDKMYPYDNWLSKFSNQESQTQVQNSVERDQRERSDYQLDPDSICQWSY